MKHNFVSLLRGCRGGGNNLLDFKFEIFCSGSELPVSHSKVIVAPQTFRYSHVAPHKLAVAPLGGGGGAYDPR
jgi:hypothetical protein